MGQSSSRSRRPQLQQPCPQASSSPPPTSSSLRHYPTAPSDDPQNPIQPPTSPQGPQLEPKPGPEHEQDQHSRSRTHSSVRRSLLNLVKPSTRTRSRVDSADSSFSTRPHRSWRGSRRWSKAPSELAPPMPTSSSDRRPVVAGDGAAGSSSLIPSTTTAATSSATTATEETEKGKGPVREGMSHPVAIGENAQELDHPPLTRDDLPSRPVESSPAVGLSSTSQSRLEPQQMRAQAQAIPIPVIHQSTCGPESELTAMNHSDNTREPAGVALATSQHQQTAELPTEHQAAVFPDQQQQQGQPQAHGQGQGIGYGQTQAPTNLANRQFPPPGTLVVVQGIVHTTDVSRSSSEHGHNPSSTTNLNAVGDTAHPHLQSTSPSDQSGNGLSAPIGGSGSRPASRTSDHVGAGDEGVTELGPSSSSSWASDSALSFGETGLTDVTTPTVEEPLPEQQPTQRDTERENEPERQPPQSERSHSAISSSSIDVLGTLLSVAAAATAASLLTGSSEPILSSGLAPPTSNSTNSSSFPPPTPSPPPLPTPLPPPPSHTRPTGISDMSPAGRAERMRQAWSTIRERLGLRASASNSTTPGNPSPGTTSRQRERNRAFTETREQMLAEMARAFNIGLGLGANGSTGAEEVQQSDEAEVRRRNGEGEGAGRSEEESDERREARTLPPEGSFERFLVELQTDLRMALSQGQERDGEGGEESESDSEDGGQHTEREVQNGNRRDVDGVESTTSTSSTSSSSTGHVDDSEDGDENAVPLSQDPSYSDSDYEEEEESAEDDYSSATTSPPPAIPEEPQRQHQTPETQPQPSPSAGSNTNMDASGRINWWRLYRFPPIVSARPGPVPPPPAPPSASAFASLPAYSPTPSTSTASPPTPDARRATTFTPSQSEASGLPRNDAANNNNTVIPVIIVGLQSVNVPNWRPVMPMDGMEGAEVFGEAQHPNQNSARPEDQDWMPPLHQPTPEWFGEDDDDDDITFGNQNRASQSDATLGGLGQNSTQQQQRANARGWQSRAANALRNLRPGGGARRGQRSEGTGEGRQSEIGAGSRTFLIYVIGGYYPPDHSIVTGGPDNLESFEALLELVELLGSMKPPTATKEDIEKSGLEVVKPSQLEQYERDGKIASNCTERCLICLDDYEEQDEVRVMECRHAFHKGCVDTWLQTGKNNCPACRSKGVSTDGPSSSPAQTVS